MRIAALFLTVFGLLGFLTSCAHTNPPPIDMQQAIQRATTPCDHEALVKYYDETVRELRSKIKEHKKMLESYGSVTFDYGKEGLALQSYSKNLIALYEQAVQVNIDMANSHRSMAGETK